MHFPDSNSRDNSSANHLEATYKPDRLKFSVALENPGKVDINLPPIDNYLGDVEPAVAEEVMSANKAYCTEFLRLVGHCLKKKLFKLVETWMDSLSERAKVLLCHEATARWIQDCDYILYQLAIRSVFHLATLVIPQAALDFLSDLGDRIEHRIQKGCQNFPDHVLSAKLEPASDFAPTIQQMLAVNKAAHSAALHLSRQSSRDQMFTDWQKHITSQKAFKHVSWWFWDYEKAIREGHFFHKIYAMLMVEVPRLLCPLSINSGMPSALNDPPYPMDPPPGQDPNFLDPWTKYCTELPPKYYMGRNHPGHFLNTIDTINDNCLMALFQANAPSLPAWKSVNLYVHDLMKWQGMTGGMVARKHGRFDHFDSIPRANAGDIFLAGAFDGVGDNPFGTGPDINPFAPNLATRTANTSNSFNPDRPRSASTRPQTEYTNFYPPQGEFVHDYKPTISAPHSRPHTSTGFRDSGIGVENTENELFAPPHKASKLNHISGVRGKHERDSGIGMGALDDGGFGGFTTEDSSRGNVGNL